VINLANHVPLFQLNADNVQMDLLTPTEGVLSHVFKTLTLTPFQNPAVPAIHHAKLAALNFIA
jgi:hypothetical protein